MEMTFINKAMQALTDFAIQFNSNSFGLTPSDKLALSSINPNQTVEVSLACQTNGPVAKMDPLTNLQVCTTLFTFFKSKTNA